MLSDRFRLPAFLLAFVLLVSTLSVTPATAQVQANFNVLAFYSGTWDAAHIDFEKEANQRFPQFGAQNGFTYTATNNWDQLNNLTASQYQVVMFLDDSPHTDAQRTGFQRYMDNGGAFFGFHVSAYNDASGGWPWFNNTLLGTGRFQSNTWGPTAVTLKAENRSHPALVNTGATFQSSVSEWYRWQNDLRNNPDIQILASIDPSSFPVGTDPNQTWYSGYYPIIWTNKNYKMIYANFGHNAMNYETNTRLSSTFDSPAQNQFMMDALKWLGGAGTPPPADQPSPTAWYTIANKANGKCIDARAAATANGTVIQQYSCNSTQAQQFQFQPTSGGFTRVNNRNDATKVIDVTGVSAADNAGLQLWTYSNGNNQQWQAVSEGSGYFHFVSRLSTKCLTVPNGSTADSTQLVQLTCNGTAAQSFQLTIA
ncbi:RICIN domain-containing protein [Kribbella sp. NBC_01484]|uniref:RICIN domain-containing protein n=1 Tax=Kribbella sp. NBC_01484 TaxID=2903579 RepID=UPI002E2EFABE|nr:RICIN domain-containing protein [Kribbella sp. NBC_01484]